MFPVLFRIGNIPVDTYYATWLVALSLALRWSVGRLALYEIDDDEGRRVMAWSFLGMLLGARATEYIWDFSAYWNDPSLFFDLNKGGLSEKGAILGALLVTFISCRRGGRVSFFRLCEVTVIPSFFAIALGRWGCFFAGCCVGVESSFPLALHFPYDAPSMTRHATQLYYSLSAALILLSLLLFEKWSFRRCGRIPPLPLLTPLGLILYPIMRISVDPLRLNFDELMPSDVALAAMIVPTGAWFLFSWKAFCKTASDVQIPE